MTDLRHVKLADDCNRDMSSLTLDCHHRRIPLILQGTVHLYTLQLVLINVPDVNDSDAEVDQELGAINEVVP